MILTIIVFLIIAYLVKSLFSDLVTNPVTLSEANEPAALTDFVPKTLAPYNGVANPKVFIGIKGKVYDVTAGKAFYGPGGPYENFAGRDASRGLALNSFDPSVLTPVTEPLDKLEDLSTEEAESLDNWQSHFDNKYKVVGTLSNPN